MLFAIVSCHEITDHIPVGSLSILFVTALGSLLNLPLTRPYMCKPKSPAQTENMGGVLIEMLTVIEKVLFLLLSPTELSKLIVLEMWECDFSYRIFIFFKKVVN